MSSVIWGLDMISGVKLILYNLKSEPGYKSYNAHN
jgi:hypothetical protein